MGQLFFIDTDTPESCLPVQARSPKQPSRRPLTAVPVLMVGVLMGGGISVGTAFADDTAIFKPSDARALGLESLRLAVKGDGGVPLPQNLASVVKDKKAAIRLGKALFWDMQVGSDGVQACASCHFHAGTDDRTTNALSPDLGAILNVRYDIPGIGYLFAGFASSYRLPGFTTKPANGTLVREDFPFVKNIQQVAETPEGFVDPAPGNSNDIVGPMGVFASLYDGVNPGSAVDAGTPYPDPIFNLGGTQNVRKVVGRNAPSVINAVFNFTNFWDGRANPHFNGLNTFGDQVAVGNLWVNDPVKGLSATTVSFDHASLASQAMAPPVTPVEMSYGPSSSGLPRRFREIGVKLLRPSPTTGKVLVPLGKQHVDEEDSVLGRWVDDDAPGLTTTYEAMIKAAFVDRYWNATGRLTLGSTPAPMEFSQMEANFSLFFGMAVALYESTLVADRSPFDQWMETGRFNRGFGPRALAGLNLFVNQGKCIQCHSGPELTSASVRSAEGGRKAIRAMAMANGNALYDNGFYNIAVTPTTDDIGRGTADVLGHPLAFSTQSIWQRLDVPHLPDLDGVGLTDITFPIFGNDNLPAVSEGSSAPVCTDANANGKCDGDEALLPEFQRTAVFGAFKTPGLRNVALTGPYFHNGGMATLKQVVQFYNRGGNFCEFNAQDFDLNIQPLGLTDQQEADLVAFLASLTDRRVKYEAAPFDHPELHVPQDGLDTEGRRILKAVGSEGNEQPLQPFLDLDPQDAVFTPSGLCSINATL